MAEQDESKRNRSLELCRRTVTTESFIEEAKAIYGDRYDYSNVVYKNSEHRVAVTCPVHGDFLIYAREHLDGKGCPKCEKGEKFLSKLKDKFGDRFGLDEFIYESSTTPVTLRCPIHGPFSGLPNRILYSPFGCPECRDTEIEDKRQAALNKRIEEQEEKRKKREEFERLRLEEWLSERIQREEDRLAKLKAFIEGRESFIYTSPFELYRQHVDEHIEGIRYGGWKTKFYEQYKLPEEEARELKCYQPGDSYYFFHDEAPVDFIRYSFEQLYSSFGVSIEQYLSHRNCIISFQDNDLIIQVVNSDRLLKECQQSVLKSEAAKCIVPASFVSIDFETLYSQRVSACSVGMVKYLNGVLVDKYYSLIRPPFDYPGKSGEELTWIHGFTEEMLKDERPFTELLPEMESFVNGLPLVAHNACVEKGCFRALCSFYGLETNIDYENIYDTLMLSKRAEYKCGISEEGRGTHTLDAVCCRFGVPCGNHHNALADAEMCGNLLLVFRNIFDGIELDEISENVKKNRKPSAPREKYNPEDKIQRTDLECVVDNLFKNQVVVLTGFTKADSQEYAHKLNELGAIIKDSVSGKTNILITGFNAGPSKMQKAQELGIRIMPEEEFLEIIKQL